MLSRSLGVLKALSIAAVAVAMLAAAAWVLLRGPDIPYETLEAKYTDADSHFVKLPGGVRMHYRDEGDRDRPLLVMLHGFGDSFTTWEGWVRELETRFRVISLDFPGHGLTRAPEGYELSIEGLADLVDAFATTLALPKFAVVGNSLGGGVAWELAVRHPDRIDALILVDAVGFPNDKPPAEVPLAFRILKYPAGRALLRNVDNRPLIEEGLKVDVYDKTLITPTLVDRWAEFQRAPGHRAILTSVPRAPGRPATQLLGSIKVPTLILWGERDPLLEPASARKFAAAIKQAKLIIYPEVGHLPQIEVPLRSAGDVADFLNAVAARP